MYGIKRLYNFFYFKFNYLIWGIDIVNDTPILDIKPYTRYDSLENFMEPEWISNDVKFNVSFSSNALSTLENIVENNNLDFYSSNEFLEVTQFSQT